MKINIKSKLALLASTPDPEPNIVINQEYCLACEDRPCIIACPSESYSWDGTQLTVTLENCLESGACSTICPYGAINWRYPRNGSGVIFKWG